MTTFRCPQCAHTYQADEVPPSTSLVRWLVQRISDGWFWSHGPVWRGDLHSPVLYKSELEASRIWLKRHPPVRVRAVRQRPGRRWEECTMEARTGTYNNSFGPAKSIAAREIDPAPAGPWELVEPETV
jgi:hypothetical protein